MERVPTRLGCRGLQEQTQVRLGLDCSGVLVTADSPMSPAPTWLWWRQGPSNSRVPGPTSLGERGKEDSVLGEVGPEAQS